MEWYEITYTTKDGRESWIYFKCKPERAKIEGEKKYKSFTYGWVIKTKLKCIKRMRNVNETTFYVREPKPDVPKRTKRKSTANSRANNPRSTKTSNRTTKAKGTNTKKPAVNEPAAITTKRKSVSKPKPATTGTTKRVSKRKPSGKQPTSRTSRSTTSVSNTTRSNSKSNRHANTGKRKDPGKSSRSTH